MEEDILNYSPTVMFRGTPCILLNLGLISRQRCIKDELIDNKSRYEVSRKYLEFFNISKNYCQAF